MVGYYSLSRVSNVSMLCQYYLPCVSVIQVSQSLWGPSAMAIEYSKKEGVALWGGNTTPNLLKYLYIKDIHKV